LNAGATLSRMSGSAEPPEPTPPVASERPYLPMAVGFHLLALPLFVAIFLAKDSVGRVTDAVCGLVLVGLGLLLQRRRRSDRAG
jgi:hypothetical protein